MSQLATAGSLGPPFFAGLRLKAGVQITPATWNSSSKQPLFLSVTLKLTLTQSFTNYSLSTSCARLHAGGSNSSKDKKITHVGVFIVLLVLRAQRSSTTYLWPHSSREAE